MKRILVCNNCRAGRCSECRDVLRAALGQPATCPCRRKGHSGEIGTRGDIEDPVAERLIIQQMEADFEEDS